MFFLLVVSLVFIRIFRTTALSFPNLLILWLSVQDHAFHEFFFMSVPPLLDNLKNIMLWYSQIPSQKDFQIKPSFCSSLSLVLFGMAASARAQKLPQSNQLDVLSRWLNLSSPPSSYLLNTYLSQVRLQRIKWHNIHKVPATHTTNSLFPNPVNI